MAAEQAAAVGAERSAGTTSDAAPPELQLTDPDAHPTQASSPNYCARSDGQTRIHQEGVKPGLDLLLVAMGGRGTSTDATRCVGTGGPQQASRPGDGSTG